MGKNGATEPRSKKLAEAIEEIEEPTLVELEDLDLRQLWQQVGLGRRDFIAHLRTLVVDPDSVDNLRWCYLCSAPGVEGDGYTVDRVNWVCKATCVANCYTCDDCGGLVTYTTFTDQETRVCDPCREARWYFCEECDEYTRDYNAGNHEHRGCECDVFATTFSIRNGGGLLANDTKTKVTLPGGVISDEGIGAISMYLRFEAVHVMGDPDQARLLSFGLPELGTSWQTREGNYTKRLSRLAYKKHQMKITPEVLSRVGDIARDHSKPIDFTVAVTRELNLGPEEFCHDDSCWWQSYSAGRCALKSNGGFAIRTFGSHYVEGRAWVMPLRYDGTARPAFQPTFETVEPDAFVVFNGYGELQGYAPSRLLAHMTGMTYRKIAFACDPMYVNSGGYLVAPEEIAHPYTDQAISLIVPEHSNLYEHERETTNV